jgi:hypothetical protein
MSTTINKKNNPVIERKHTITAQVLNGATSPPSPVNISGRKIYLTIQYKEEEVLEKNSHDDPTYFDIFDGDNGWYTFVIFPSDQEDWLPETNYLIETVVEFGPDDLETHIYDTIKFRPKIVG